MRATTRLLLDAPAVSTSFGCVSTRSEACGWSACLDGGSSPSAEAYLMRRRTVPDGQGNLGAEGWRGIGAHGGAPPGLPDRTPAPLSAE